MSGSRITIAGIMTAVVFAAIDSLLIRNAEYFAGVFLIAIAPQVGFFLAIAGRTGSAAGTTGPT